MYPLMSQVQMTLKMMTESDLMCLEPTKNGMISPTTNMMFSIPTENKTNSQLITMIWKTSMDVLTLNTMNIINGFVILNYTSFSQVKSNTLMNSKWYPLLTEF